ncbi:MAG: AAA family ATPase [Actinomycetota bacterium]|nr:AAA family ATPase [Actinomycetota bacterium]
MTRMVKALVAVDAGIEPDAVQTVLPGDDREIEIVGIVDGLEEAWTTLQETPTDLLIVAAGGYSDRALFLIDAAVKQRPDRPVVVLTEGSPNGFLRRLFEVGADDVIALPESPERVGFALAKAVARKDGAAVATGVAVAPMICVLGPKGGTGKTLTTCNLGVSLAKSAQRTVIVDLDLQFGDVSLALGLTPEKTIADLARSGGSLDIEKIDGYLVDHPSGVRVLTAPTRPDHAGAVTAEFLREVYTTLRSAYDFVVVDTPPGFTPEVIASIDSSSDVCMVGMLDSLSLKNTKLGLETLDLMGYKRDRIRILLNRAGSRVGITADDVRTVIGREPDVYVPSDRDIPRSVNEGMPIVLAKERSDAAKAFRSLAARYLENQNAPANANGGRKRFRRKG